MRYSREYVVLARDRLLVQIFDEDVAFVLPDLEPSRGTRLAGVGQEINDGLVVDLNEGGLQGTWGHKNYEHTFVELPSKLTVTRNFLLGVSSMA